MKKSIFLLLSLLMVGVSYGANYKVTSRSERKVPVWVGGNETGYFILSTVSAVSLDDAKSKLMEQVKLRYIESIAQNISHRSASLTSQKTTNNRDSFRDEFISSLKVNSANVPFLKGISQSKISDVYWEVRSEKGSGVVSYNYSIRYPAPKEELDRLVREFDRRDEEMVHKYNLLKGDLAMVNSLGQIAQCIAECKTLESYFFDQTRKGSASELQKLYSSLYDQITLSTTREELGLAVVEMRLNGRKLNSTLRPTLKYDKGIIGSVSLSTQSGEYTLSYDPSLCREGLPYSIEMVFTIGARRVVHAVHFTYTKNSVSLEGVGRVALVADSCEDGLLSGVSVTVNLETKGINGVLNIGAISLSVAGVEGMINIYQPFKVNVSDGTFSLRFKHEGELKIASNSHSSSTIRVVRGEIRGSYGTKAEPFRKSITLPYDCNW
ncbi:MAG: hypothetical protein SNH13_05145 [Rikenellaceae bacterium]